MRFFRKILLFIFSYSLQPILKKYLSKPRNYQYQDLNLVIYPGVFHPGFFFSTQFLLKQLSQLELKDKRVLELGAGSGLISFVVKRMGGIITASDISENVVRSIKLNQKSNKLFFEVIQSDLFDKIPKTTFDVICINPPYYKRQVQTEADFAWYCGENLEYFKTLFRNLMNYVHTSSAVLMVLSEDCAINEIKEIAIVNGFDLKLVKSKKIWLEENYIFEIVPITN